MSNKIVENDNSGWIELTDGVDAVSGYVQVQSGVWKISRTAGAAPTDADGYITLSGVHSVIDGDIEKFCRGATGGRVWGFSEGDPRAKLTCGFVAAGS